MNMMTSAQITQLKNKMKTHPTIFVDILNNEFNKPGSSLNEWMVNLTRILESRNTPITHHELDAFKLWMSKDWLLFQPDDANRTYKITENTKYIGNAFMKQEELLFIRRNRQ
jgi:hypothetical protein